MTSQPVTFGSRGFESYPRRLIQKKASLDKSGTRGHLSVSICEFFNRHDYAEAWRLKTLSAAFSLRCSSRYSFNSAAALSVSFTAVFTAISWVILITNTLFV